VFDPVALGIENAHFWEGRVAENKRKAGGAVANEVL